MRDAAQTLWLSMKAKAVSALRSERGLQPEIWVAEPPVVGLTSPTANERRANTIKTYILRNSRTVQPQCQPRPATSRALLGHTTPVAAGPVLFIGLDVHSDSIAVSLAPSDFSGIRRYGLIGGTHDDVLRLAKKLQAAHPHTQLHFCYEAGPHGYPLCRCLRAHGYDCILVAPSKVPRQPGDRVKTNRRDADQLARVYRSGDLTPSIRRDIPNHHGYSGIEIDVDDISLETGWKAKEADNGEEDLKHADSHRIYITRLPNAKLTDDEECAKDNRIGACG